TAVLVSLAAVGGWAVGGSSTARATLSDGDVVVSGFPAHDPCVPGTDVNCENGQPTDVETSRGDSSRSGRPEPAAASSEGPKAAAPGSAAAPRAGTACSAGATAALA